MYYGTPPIVTNGLVLALDASNTLSYVSGSSVWNNMISASSFSITSNSTSTASFQSNPPAIYVTQSTSAGTQASITGTFPFSENLAIELWYKTDTTGSGFANQLESPGIIQIGNYNSNASLTLWDWSAQIPGSHRIQTYVNNGTTWSHINTGLASISDANWVNKYHHIIMNFSGSSGKWDTYNLYIDSVLWSTINFGATPFPSSSIGGGNILAMTGAAGGSARNSYSVLKVYNRTLSITEIAQNYNALKTRFGLT